MAALLGDDDEITLYVNGIVDDDLADTVAGHSAYKLSVPVGKYKPKDQNPYKLTYYMPNSLATPSKYSKVTVTGPTNAANYWKITGFS